MRFSTLDAWLTWQAALHPSGMELGLDRCRQVRSALAWGPLPFPVVTVGGTNGKGSTVAFIESVYQAAGYRVGAYVSPHLLRYNERIRIDAEEVGDEELMVSFERIDAARGETTITYFEFATFAAIDRFLEHEVDVAVLEVGLGGGLDAVNLFDADVAVISSIGIDHQRWLGSDRASVAQHKAGIFRAAKPAVIGDRCPPPVLEERARVLGAPAHRIGRDFGWRWADERQEEWVFWEGEQGRCLGPLPRPRLPAPVQMDNAASALMAVHCLAERRPVGAAAMRTGVEQAWLAGRYQRLGQRPSIIADVAHNPQAATALARALASEPVEGRTHVVVAMFSDKDHAGVFAPLAELADTWQVAGLPGPRGADAMTLAAALERAGTRAEVSQYATVREAYAGARARSGPDDRIVVCGSFRTVAEVLAHACERSPV